MTKLSEPTARWIIAHQLQTGDQQDKLHSLVDTYWGPTEAKAELIQDEISEDGEEEEAEEQQHAHTWKKADETYISLKYMSQSSSALIFRFLLIIYAVVLFGVPGLIDNGEKF